MRRLLNSIDRAGQRRGFAGSPADAGCYPSPSPAGEGCYPSPSPGGEGCYPSRPPGSKRVSGRELRIASPEITA